MSVLEKIVQAEKDAKALLVKTREENALLLTTTNETLADMRTKNAQDIAKQANELVKKTNQDISEVTRQFDIKKEEITKEIAANALRNKQKIVEQIMKELNK